MRVAIVCGVVLLACGHHETASVPVSVNVTCGEQTRSLAVTGDLRIDEHLCGQPWTALRIEHGKRTELVKAVAGREVWLRRVDRRAVIEVRAGSAITSSFDGVTELAEDTPPAPAASLEIDANGAITNLALADLRARSEGSGSASRDVSLCALAASYVAKPRTIEVTGEAAQPVIVTPDECKTRGLVLRVSSQGELRLRTATGGHLLQQVHRIRLSL